MSSGSRLLALALVSSLHAAPPTGSITRHVWTGVGGTAIADLTGLADYPDSPDTAGTLTSFLAPTDFADNYGTRVFGWVHAPVTGDYTFWIHGDDNCELWLSDSVSPDDRRLVASVPEWTNAGEWTKFAQQQSAPVALEAGRYYFVEALQKEGTGGDNLGVAWSYPGQSRTYLPGSSLSAWQNVAPEPADDSATLRAGETVAVPVLANDLEPNGSADFDPATLAIVTPPDHGIASVDGPLIRYTHDGGPDTADSLIYEIRDQAGLTATARIDFSLSAAARLPLDTSAMPAEPPAEAIEVVDAFPGLTFSSPIDVVSPPGETNRLFILEKGGDLELIPDLSSPSKTLFLNLDSVVNGRPGESFQTSSEQGLLGLAFHPDFATNRRFFVVYSVTVGGVRYQRLSEFQASSGNPNVADTSSEAVILQQRNDASNHNGGDLHFGPDGYLYMSWGDEGNANDTLNNSQTITKDFWSSVTRIDVDLEPEDHTAADGTGSDDANLEPNAHPAIVLDGSGNPRYEVPADNPFVGATSFNGSSVTPTQVRTEFCAVGLRNPWRMEFDPLTGDLWIGDVGQGAWEEIDFIPAAELTTGHNFEWAFREGDHNGPKWNQRPAGWPGGTPPIWEYGRSLGYSVTGGLVYRGTGISSLYGLYLCADYGSGNIWAVDPSESPATATLIAGETGIVGFGTDPSNGDVLMADINSGVIRRLVPTPGEDTFPATLAETGLFADPAALVPNPGLVAYDINLPFWSDHARKQRWFGIPDPAPTFGYEAEGNWSLPEGTIWVKHFDLDLERGNPATARRVETRVIVRTDDITYGVSYKWNETGTEATLADTAGENLEFEIDDGGGTVTQTWRIPSRAECLTCHSPQAGHALSFRTRQLNRDGEIAGLSGNFLELLHTSGYLDSPPDDSDTLPRHVAPDESDYSLEARARSWMAVNCAYCHNDQGTVPADWDASAHLKLFETGLVNGLPGGTLLDPDDRLVVPGEEEHSVIVHRAAARNGYTRMPPLATSEIDETGVQLLIDWIESELPGRQSYDDWRTSIFGASPDGEPGEDPDGDGRDNETEFLQMTNPQVADAPPGIAVAENASGLTLTLPDLPGRGHILESSTDLGTWTPWPVEGNDGLSRPPGQPWSVEVPADEPHRFFRARIEER